MDAWGKLPSSIFEGNLFEFGGFSECFHIERDHELYKTKYCMGNLIANFDALSNPHSAALNPPMPFEDEPMFQARIALPQ